MSHTGCFNKLRLVVIVILSVPAFIVACTLGTPINERWKGKSFETASRLITFFEECKSNIAPHDSAAAVENMCYMIWHSGEYIIKCKGKNDDIHLLPCKVDKISFDNEVVNRFIETVDVGKFADHYFMLQAMKRGEEFDAARDGLTATVFFPIRPVNSNDYAKLREVFSTRNSALHAAYLEKMKFPIENSGCTKEFCAIQPLIAKNVADCKLKDEILAMYGKYIPLMAGEKAPTPPLVDSEGKQHTFKEYQGKVLVIDVWATWCSSCLKKMPAYIHLKEQFADNDNVEFITVSVDRSNKLELWKTTLEKRGMKGLTNLITGTSGYSQFEDNYNISGVPRYIVIDTDGNIVNAYAPGPDNGLRELVETTLKH